MCINTMLSVQYLQEVSASQAIYSNIGSKTQELHFRLYSPSMLNVKGNDSSVIKRLNN